MDQPKRHTRPGIGFVLLVFALIVGISLSTTVALPLGHAASSSSAGPSVATSHATQAGSTAAGGKRLPAVGVTAAGGKRSPAVGVTAAGGKRSPAVGVTAAGGKRSPAVGVTAAGGKRSPAASPPASAYLRVLHAVPNMKPIDIYLNGSLTITNLAYKSYSGYDPVYPGVWNISIYHTGATPVLKNLTYNVTENLASGSYYTLALVGNLSTIHAVLLTDSNAAPATNSFNVRFFDAASNESAVTAVLLNNSTGATVLTFTSTAFGAVTGYSSVLNQTLNATVSLTATPSTHVAYANNTPFTTNDYTIVLVGFVKNSSAPLLELFLLDGSYSGTPTSVHPIVVTMSQLTPLSAFTTLPASFLFSETVTNASLLPGAPVSTDQLWLNVTDFKTGAKCTSIELNTSILPVMAGVVYFTSVPTWGTVASESWAFTLTSAMIVNTTSCPNFAVDPEIISVASAITDPINGTASGLATQETAFVYVAPSSSLHVSSTPSAPTTFSIYANYTAQYVGRVGLSIYNPVNGLVTFTANLIRTGTTPTTVTWLETVPGNYPYTLSVYTAVAVYNTTGFIAVMAPGATFYNSTTWVNSTLISGLSSSAAGTILLVVGLLIGMLVAMVVGRMVWGGPKAVPPAQPWAQKPGAVGANTCSVCGQSFGTPEELAAHSKSEHGMQ